MTTAVVLIEAERDALQTLGGRLADLDGVAEAYSVTGEWDFVAIIRVPRHEMLADVVTGELVKLPGVSRTQTMVAFEVFSRHDLEAMFSIGGCGRARAERAGRPTGWPSEHLNPEFGVLFDELLRRRVERLAVEPEDLVALVEAIRIYHMVIEGMLALTGQHFIIDYNERMGTLPGFVEGFTKVARDEHRHVAFGARFLRDMAREDERYAAAIRDVLVEIAPAADGVLRPKWVPPGDDDVEIFGVTVNESRAFAMQALQRRLKVIGLA